MKLKINTSMLRRLFIILGAVFAFVVFCACADDKSSSNRTIGGVYAVDMSVTYDGRPHSITVMNTLATDTVLYSTDGISYSAINPTFVLPDTYTVFFKVSRSGYKELVSSATVTITPCILSDISAQNVSVDYDGLPHSVTVDGLLPSDTVSYSTDGLNFSSEAPSFTAVGEYTVYYSVERNYGYYKSSCTLTISPSVFGRYFNPAAGVVELSPHTAIVDVDGYSGFIGDDPFSVTNDIMTYKDLPFTKLSDADCVYKLVVSGGYIYFCAGANGVLSVSFASCAAVIKLDEDELLSVPDCNYCESGIATDYIDLHFEQAFEHTNDITEVAITLSNREVNPITFDCAHVTYDGKPHGLDLPQSVIYLSEQTTFTDVGRHTVSVLIVSDKYLPLVTDCTLVILPDISGTFVAAEHVIQIADGIVKIDGAESGELSVINDDWALNGKPITVTSDGIMYDGVGYAATTDKILLVRLDNDACAVALLPQSIDQLVVRYDGTELTFTAETDPLLNIALSCDSVTMILKGVTLPALVPNKTETYVIGKSDLKPDVVIIDVKTSD